MSNTKITLKIEERILHAFNEMLDRCYMKRDAFLNHAIKTEIPYLEKDLKGFRLSHIARQYISVELRKMDLVTINVVVEKSTAEELRRVLKMNNIVRDSFINRLIMFLICPESLQAALELPRVKANSIEKYSSNGTEFYDLQGISISPLEEIRATIDDPLVYIREFLEIQGSEPIYRTEIHQNLVGFNCYLPDDDIPGTAEHAIKERKAIRLVKTLFEDNRKWVKEK